ncbi:MAG: hypothetical protein CM15mP8_2920 [Methanobacteriota archaeon]|nr:MAG: hypothetical protein CM15mP8_2920 [Euryarchaeota archaeon]
MARGFELWYSMEIQTPLRDYATGYVRRTFTTRNAVSHSSGPQKRGTPFLFCFFFANSTNSDDDPGGKSFPLPLGPTFWAGRPQMLVVFLRGNGPWGTPFPRWAYNNHVIVRWVEKLQTATEPRSLPPWLHAEFPMS